MFDVRFFSHQYDRYEPSQSIAASGDAALVEGTAAATGLPCRLFPQPGSFAMGETGIQLDYDATMLVPNTHTLQPEAVGQQPHHVKVTALGATKFYVVLICFSAVGYYKKVLLQQRRQ